MKYNVILSLAHVHIPEAGGDFLFIEPPYNCVARPSKILISRFAPRCAEMRLGW